MFPPGLVKRTNERWQTYFSRGSDVCEFPEGRAIKTKTSQQSTMKACLTFQPFFDRGSGADGGRGGGAVGWRGATSRRQLVNPVNCRSIRETQGEMTKSKVGARRFAIGIADAARRGWLNVKPNRLNAEKFFSNSGIFSQLEREGSYATRPLPKDSPRVSIQTSQKAIP